MTRKNSTEVEGLLKSVLVPSFPPNRSQWKKLELAMKFINNSKAVVERKRSENHGGKSAKSTQKEDDKVRKELSLSTREVDRKKRVSADLELLREQRQNHNEAQPSKKLKVLGKRDSLSKLLGTVGHFM